MSDDDIEKIKNRKLSDVIGGSVDSNEKSESKNNLNESTIIDAPFKIEMRTRIAIYILSVIFMPVGFISGIYLITREDKEYNEIGKMIIEILGSIFGVLALILAFLVLLNHLNA